MPEMSLANIQKAAQGGNYEEAEKLLVEFLRELFPLDVLSIDIRRDSLSLNSVNGFINLNKADEKTGEKKLFFKFHHEENEEGLTEYYNSILLSENGFPVEMPVYISKEVGKQVLIYPVKTSERMADVCKKLDIQNKTDNAVVSAQENLDEISLERYLATLHEATSKEVAEEPIMQLFYNRLVDDKKASSQTLGGRYAQFYKDRECILPGVALNFEELKKLKWQINGVDYNETLEAAFVSALKILSPEAHGNYAAVVAHGDAHNGNVWFNKEGSNLSLFDPAFAGKHIPALLAEIKTTFHNIFAHPLWLYDSAEATKSYKATCTVIGDRISVIHNWQLSPIREAFLKTKAEKLWAPLIFGLKSKGKLLEGWQSYMRSALFCCPTLVMNLRANAGNERNSHNPITSALGFAISIMLSSAPANGKDVVSEFFDQISPK